MQHAEAGLYTGVDVGIVRPRAVTDVQANPKTRNCMDKRSCFDNTYWIIMTWCLTWYQVFILVGISSISIHSRVISISVAMRLCTVIAPPLRRRCVDWTNGPTKLWQ